MEKGKLFSDIIESLKKSMGGGSAKKSDEPDPKELEQQAAGGTNDDDDDDDDDEVEVTEVIKALTDKLEEVVEGQDALLKALNKLAEQGTLDGEFKKSMVEALEAIASTPASKKGITSAAEAAVLAKGLNQPKPGERRHKQFTLEMKDRVTDILTKSVAAGELDVFESGKIETQVNKSLRDPHFQLDQKYQEFLSKKFGA
jgi:hypothetical protein